MIKEASGNCKPGSNRSTRNSKRSIVGFSKVNKGDFEAFVYQGDISANLTPNRKLLPQAPLNARQFVNRWNKSKDIIALLIAWYAAEQIPTAFLDIGSNIGTDSIRIAKFSRLIDARFPITAFEPGVNAALVPHNLRLNEVDDIVDFEEKCMSDNSKPVVLFGEAGMSVNNRMVNRRPATESFSKIVNCTSVSKHLSADKFSGRHPVMKIDTQGAEWFIWNGMKQEISRRYFTMVMDMSPWALSASVSPGTFLSEVLQSFHLYDLGNTRQQFVELTMTNLEESIAASSGPNRVGRTFFAFADFALEPAPDRANSRSIRVMPSSIGTKV